MRRVPTALGGLLLAAALLAPAPSGAVPGLPARAGGDPVATRTTFLEPFKNGELRATVVERAAEGESTPDGSVAFLVDGEALGSSVLHDAGYRDGVWSEASLPDTAPKRRPVTFRARYLPAEGWAPSRSFTYERVPPTLLASLDAAGVPSSSGWFAVPVSVVWTCVEGSSAVEACPEPLEVRRGREVVRRTLAADDGGLDSTRTVVKVDRVAPRVSAERRPGRAPRCRATDALSGVESCERVLGATSGTPGGVRRRAFEMTATDRAGNTATVRGTYRVG